VPVSTACGTDNICATFVCDPDTSTDASGCVVTLNNARCNDGQSCTDDICTPSGCSFVPNDDNTCTGDDLCQTYACDNGACLSSPVQCADDGASCTLEQCDSRTGDCVTAVNPDVCVDSECSMSECAPGEAGSDPTTGCVTTTDTEACDDDDPCTLDTCDAETGRCVNTPMAGLVCDDGIACTIGDVCNAGGQCVGGDPDDNACGGLSGTDPCRAGFCDPTSADANAQGCVVDNAPAGTVVETDVPCGSDLCGADMGNLVCDGEGNQVSTCDPAYGGVSEIGDDECVEQEYVVYALIEDPATGALRGSVRCISFAGAITCETAGVDPTTNLPLLKIYDELLCPGTAPVLESGNGR